MASRSRVEKDAGLAFAYGYPTILPRNESRIDLRQAARRIHGLIVIENGADSVQYRGAALTDFEISMEGIELFLKFCVVDFVIQSGGPEPPLRGLRRKRLAEHPLVAISLTRDLP